MDRAQNGSYSKRVRAISRNSSDPFTSPSRCQRQTRYACLRDPCVHVPRKRGAGGAQAMQNWFDAFQNMNVLGLDSENQTSIYYAKHRWYHSFQFHHDAAAASDFWQRVKQETNLRATF